MNSQQVSGILIIVLIFLAVYGWLATPLAHDGLTPRFDWPDEVANHFWSSNYAKTSSLTVFEPLNQVAENQIHPRSINVRPDGSLVPGSFLGLILLYGFLAKIFTTGGIIYFTPFLAMFGALSFYGIIKRIFDDRIAVISVMLLLIHPAWWYYSVTSLLPNVPFISLLLISFYFLVRSFDADPYKAGYQQGRVKNIGRLNVLVAAVAGGIALSIRPSEIVWVALSYAVLLFVIRSRLNLVTVVGFVAIVVLALLPSLFYQQAVYGDFLATGYSQLQNAESSLPASCQACSVAGQLIAPFGFHPQTIAVNVWNHLLSNLWQWSLLVALGLAAFVASPSLKKPAAYGFLFLGAAVSAFLAIYYGSWQFTDLLTLNLNTLGISYVRYWLPIYLFGLPFAALGILWLVQFFGPKIGRLLIGFLIIYLGYQSAQLVLIDKADSILPVRERIASYHQAAAEVNNITEENSVIVTVRKDKLFFPERKVIHTFDALSVNPDLTRIIGKLSEQVPVYYYALGPEPKLELEYNVVLEQVSTVGSEVLYKVSAP